MTTRLYLVRKRRMVRNFTRRPIAPEVVDRILELARHAHTLLRIDRAFIRTLVRAKEHILELYHAGVSEKQSGIPTRNKRRRRHSRVSVLDEEVYVGLADFRAAELFSCKAPMLKWGNLYQ